MGKGTPSYQGLLAFTMLHILCCMLYISCDLGKFLYLPICSAVFLEHLQMKCCLQMLQAYGFIHNAVLSNKKDETKQNFHKKIKDVYQKLLIWLNFTNLGCFSFRKYNFLRFIKDNLFLIMCSALHHEFITKKLMCSRKSHKQLSRLCMRR